ncbi:MAG TPA: BMP family ABC transporter substrate-binding protein [Acidimicrobiia bacterium]|nr:BMP family ABC transporter substrate-binding protein [Acidimicrobiia bacterium]
MSLIAVFAVLGLVLAACSPAEEGGEETTTTEAGGDPTTTEAMADTTTSAAPEGSSTTGAPTFEEAVVTCLVTDLAGVDDRSFNAAAWQGVLDAEASGAVAADPILLESDEQADYAPNLDQCLAQGAQHIVTVGFELGDATATYAAANPDVTFTIVDFAYDPAIANVRGLIYQTDEAAFAAGYLAAGVSQSGVIGTYGGLNIPTVSIFMDGLAKGVNHYNEVNGAAVTVLGWDVEAADGIFTGTFDPADPVVRSTCESLLDEGADVILPVGGAINLPCGTAIQDRGIEAALIGVDQDAFEAMPAEYQDLWLVTIEKGISIQVQRSLEDHASGVWENGVTVGTLENDGIGLSEYHSWADRVPPELDAEVQQILADIAAGTLDINS